MSTLLERAQQITVSRANRRAGKATDEELDLALAWMMGDVTAKQLCVALGKTNGKQMSAWLWAGGVVRDAVRDGRVVRAAP